MAPAARFGLIYQIVTYLRPNAIENTSDNTNKNIKEYFTHFPSLFELKFF